jgi:hypothetical protein
MKRNSNFIDSIDFNFAVLSGAFIAIVSAFLFTTIIINSSTAESLNHHYINVKASSYSALVILPLMLLSWRWRGILWVILSITGVAWTIVYINYVITNYQAGKVAGVSYEMGFYLILLGYAIVIGGSIWDIIKKRNLQRTSKS